MRPVSCMAVAVACSCSSDSSPSLEASIGHGMQPPKKKLKKKKESPTPGVPVGAQQVKNPTSIHEDTSSIPGLTWGVKHLALPQAVV